MNTQWLILIGLISFRMLLLSTARRREGSEDAENEYDDAEDDDDADEDKQELGDDLRPLTTEPNTRKPPKQRALCPLLPVVAEADRPKAKPIVKQVAKTAIKTSVAKVKKAFKVEKADPKKQATANFLDKDATLFTPRRMLCLPSTSGFQCLYQ
jgi:hypothetical protein